MFIVGNFLIAVASILGIILNLVWWLLVIRALISWFSPDPYNRLVQFLYQTTEPILLPIRRYMPPMAIDFSVLVALLVIVFLRSFVVASVYEVGWRMKNQQTQQQYQILDNVSDESNDIAEETGMVRTGN